jgi:hypothetical protein
MKRTRYKRVEVVEMLPTVSPRAFIKAWQESATVAEVARKVGRSKNAVRVRAFRFRQWFGIPLKRFPTPEVEPVDWDELRRYAESFEEGIENPSENDSDTTIEVLPPSAG